MQGEDARGALIVGSMGVCPAPHSTIFTDTGGGQASGGQSTALLS